MVPDDRPVDQVDLFRYGVGDLVGTGAEDGEDFERACVISALDKGRAEGFFFRRPLSGRVPLGGKKWSSSAWLIFTGSQAPGGEGNIGVFLGAISCLAVQMLFGEVLERKSAQ